MKTIGLIGGMSWESTAVYYRILNEVVERELGGLHSAKVILYSVDFHEIERLQAAGNWDRCADILAECAVKLEKAGADYILLCANTVHKVAPQIQRRITIPLLHIAEPTIENLKNQGITTAALLGTRYTMTEDFYKNKLTKAGIEVLVPGEQAIAQLNDIIYNELCRGIVSQRSKELCLQIIDQLAGQGAKGVILACTELGLLIQQKDSPLPVFDTLEIHAAGAAMLAIEE